MAITEQQVQSALKEITDLSTGKDYVVSNEARNIKIDGDDISLDIVLGYPAKSVIESIRKQVADKLNVLAKELDLDELVVVTWTYDTASRHRSYELLAKAFGLG